MNAFLKHRAGRRWWRAAVLALFLIVTLTAVVNARVWTDQEDYSPGSVVTISGDNSDGAGYLAGETVVVDVQGPNGYAATCEAVADEAGAWSCQVTLWADETAVGEYTFTAIGQISQVTESGSFTDGWYEYCWSSGWHEYNLQTPSPNTGVVGTPVNVSSKLEERYCREEYRKWCYSFPFGGTVCGSCNLYSWGCNSWSGYPSQSLNFTLGGANAVGITNYNGVATASLPVSQASTYLAVSWAGISKGTNFTPIPGDTTPPIITYTRVPESNYLGWNNTDVTLAFTVTDPESPIAWTSGCGQRIFWMSGGEGCIAQNTAGLQSNVSVSIYIDKTPPTVSATKSPPPNTYGWNNGTVMVYFSGSDELSGIQGCSGPEQITTQGANQSATGTCWDKANNFTSATVAGINIDTTKPSTSGNASPPPNANGWNNSDVTVSFTGTDDLSGIDACPSTVTLSNEGTNQVVPGACTDKAGNTGDTIHVSGIYIDKTAPSVKAKLDPPPNADGWNNSNVDVTFVGTDDLSGIAACDPAVTISDEGLDQGATGGCSDKAGNVNTASAFVDLDRTKPVVNCETADNLWHNADVSIACTAEDALSGLVNPDDASFSLETSVPDDTETDQGFTGSHEVVDRAGNSNGVGPIGAIKVDRKDPEITISSPTGGTYVVGQVALASYTCGDNGSGVASCSGPVGNGSALETSTIGTKTFTVNATDNVGNMSTKSVTYDVVYAFTGFFPPIDNPPTLNSVKAGSAVPAKFSLGGDYGLGIIATGYPKSVKIACDSGVPIDAIEETVTAGNSSLQYNPVTGQYTYVWKTDKAWAATCRQFQLMLVDGTLHVANFKFK